MGESGHSLVSLVVTNSIVWEFVTDGIRRSSFKGKNTWQRICDWMLKVVHPVSLTDASGRPELGCSESQTALFRGGFYLSPMAGSSSLSWPFALS